MKQFVANRKGPWQKRFLYIGILSTLLLALLVFATCGDDDPEEIPDTATSVAVAPTPEAPGTTLRPRNEWTEDAPATRAEIEAELGKYRGKSISVLDGGGAWQAAHRKAYYIPSRISSASRSLRTPPPPSSAKSRHVGDLATLPWTSVYGALTSPSSLAVRATPLSSTTRSSTCETTSLTS